MKLLLAALGVGVLAVVSLFVGVIDLAGAPADAPRLLLVSRIPRTVSVLLTGAALAVVGLIVQMLARNRFVEPSTVGTVEWASLGLLAVTILAPATPVVVKMAVAAVFALAGTAVFLRLLRAVPLRDELVVPLVGLVLAGVVGAAATFVAFRHDLLQTLSAWTLGDFSGVLAGRYEMLWLVGVLTVVAYVAADRFTVAGMGADHATNLGLDHTAVVRLGLGLVAVVTAVVVVVVGSVPFLGLVVPNLVSLTVGDDVRRGLPWVAVLGAGLVLAADLVGRVVRMPYEVPVGVVMGVLGSALFLWFLLRRPRPAAARVR
jgi:iron complex transport system permease protein